MTVSNNDITIYVDARLETSIKIEACEPDILVIDKKNNSITIIETQKKLKIHFLITLAMTWDDIITKITLKNYEIIYKQSLIIKKKVFHLAIDT